MKNRTYLNLKEYWLFPELKLFIKLLPIAFSVIIVLPIQSQGQVNLREAFSEAEYFHRIEEYSEAIFYYKQLIEHMPQNANVFFQIGMCYLNIPGEEEKSITYFETASQKISPNYKRSRFEEEYAPLHVLFYLAQAYRMNNELDKALMRLNEFTNSPNYHGNYNERIVQNEIEACRRAKIIKDRPIKVEYKNLGRPINNERDNFNAVLSADGSTIVYITSLPFYDAVFMSKKIVGEWTEPENITPQIVSDGDCYPTSLSSDGKELYLVKKERDNKGRLYVSYYRNNKWTPMELLNKNINSRRSERHAAISPDGKYLYITSNRRRGKGEFDIWRSEKDSNGEWGKPENLGFLINTVFNEATPFITSNGVLFFSSQGHQNMGGYDIFYSRKTRNVYSAPVNIGFPINDTRDNLFYFPVGDGTTGYISLRRPEGLGGLDIYKVTITQGDQLKDLIEE